MYTLFGYIISICLAIHLSIVTCYIEGEVKTNNHVSRESCIAIFNRDDDQTTLSTFHGAPNIVGKKLTDFQNKCLLKFFSEVKRKKSKHASKRQLHKKHKHRKYRVRGQRRNTVCRLRNDTDTSGTKDRKCVFPFVYEGETKCQCQPGTESIRVKWWCSTTDNFDRDMRWAACADDGSPVRRNKVLKPLSNADASVNQLYENAYEDARNNVISATVEEEPQVDEGSSHYENLTDNLSQDKGKDEIQTHHDASNNETDPVQMNVEIKDDGSGEEKLMHDEENAMIDYVSDNITKDGKNEKNLSTNHEDQKNSVDGNELKFGTFTKMPKLTNLPRLARLRKNKKYRNILSGAKNINIFIINSKNNTLDNTIEDLIAQTSQPSEELDETNVRPEIKTTETGSSFHNMTGDTKGSLDSSINSSLVNNTSEDTSLSLDTIVNASQSTENISSHDTIQNRTNNDIFSSDVNITSPANSQNDTKDVAAISNINSTAIKKESTNPVESVVGDVFDMAWYNETSQFENAPKVAKSKKSKNGAGEIEIHSYGGNANGEKCIFPFVYDGNTYFSCINLNRDKPWCSTRANYDKVPVWGYCTNTNSTKKSFSKTVISPEKDDIQDNKLKMLHSQGEEFISKHRVVETYVGNGRG